MNTWRAELKEWLNLGIVVGIAAGVLGVILFLSMLNLLWLPVCIGAICVFAATRKR
jgi:hypothetical protein